MTFQKYRDRGGEWRWRLRAENNRTIADSAEGYVTEANVDRAINSIKRLGYELEHARVVIPARAPRGTFNYAEGGRFARLAKFVAKEQ